VNWGYPRRVTEGSDNGRGALPIEQLPVAAAVVTLDGCIRTANTLFCELFGVDEALLSTTPASVIADPVDTSWPIVHLQRSSNGQSSRQPVHHRFRRADGGRVVANLRTSPWRDESGAVAGMIAFFTPANADLPNRYQLLWQALEDQQELMTEWALDGTIMFCNRACREFFGWDETVIGRNLDEVYDWGPEDSRVLTVSGALAGVRDEPRQRIYGNDRIVEWADTAVRDEYGNITSVFSMGRDISARVRAEEAVRVNERRFRAMVNNIQDTVLLMNADGTLIDRASLQRPNLGYDAGGFTGERLVEYLHPDDVPRSVELFNETLALEEGATAWAELRAQRAEGGYSWLEVSGVNLLDDSDVNAIVLTVRNIDDRKRVEQELSERSLRAQEELRERLALVAQVGHELRNPLQGIQAFSDVLAHEALAPRPAEAVSAIGRQAVTLRRVVDDLLDASQLELGTLRIRREVVDLQPIIDDVAVVARQLVHAGVVVSSTPLQTPLRYVMGDGDRIRQALANLLSNACKHTPSGSVVIEASDGDAAGTVRLSVVDTGTGISQDDVDRLFRPFERGHDAEHSSLPGVGLGLAIVTGIAGAHGGSVGAAPRPEGGSVFWMQLPTTDAAAPLVAQADPRVGLPSRRVLLVDDEPLNLLANKFLLTDLGCTVTTAASAEDAVAFAAHREFDVVISDIHLPGMNGFDLARALRALSAPQMVIAIMSGDTSAEASSAAMAAGADTFLTKPAALADLAAVLRIERS
jgi:PAS domain S-box-containing protein